MWAKGSQSGDRRGPRRRGSGREPVTQTAVQLRNPYVDPLNYIQVEMLRRLRVLSDPDGPEARSLRDVIILTINGIAAGLKNTG